MEPRLKFNLRNNCYSPPSRANQHLLLILKGTPSTSQRSRLGRGQSSDVCSDVLIQFEVSFGPSAPAKEWFHPLRHLLIHAMLQRFAALARPVPPSPSISVSQPSAVSWLALPSAHWHWFSAGETYLLQGFSVSSFIPSAHFSIKKNKIFRFTSADPITYILQIVHFIDYIDKFTCYVAENVLCVQGFKETDNNTNTVKMKKH